MTHIDQLQSQIATMLSRVALGIKDGAKLAGCSLLVTGKETEIVISGEVYFGADVLAQRDVTDASTAKTKRVSVAETQRQVQRDYKEEAQKSGNSSANVSLDATIVTNTSPT